MTSCKTLIMEYSSQTTIFGLEELWSWISAIAKYSRNTVMCLVSRMVYAGDLIRVARGVYASASDKTIFKAEPSKEEIKLFEELRNRFPFAPFCIYNGSVLIPLQHHLSCNNITYVETDRNAVESVFNFIRESSDRVWLMPDADFVYRYIDLSKGGIIVKPLVTEAPLQYINGVSTPTIEKLLVDIRKDADFAYLQGMEATRMIDNANTLYVVNKTRLNRYARRRGCLLICSSGVWRQ